ncbi:hypothetical protein [Paenibacillus sp. FSL H8-0034]|uniref:hypothetical protein n=1 Tax=Paenibacillus sp. FSL H8-0034 TaxID=2954671 RepID=UPI0030FB59D5
MFTKRNKIFIGILLLWAATMATTNADGVSTNPQAGTIDDPVITKSYFEQNIKLKVAEELNKQTITEEKVKQIIASELSSFKPNPGDSGKTTPAPVLDIPSQTDTSNLSVIKLDPGQSIYGGAGTEIIVRTGKVTIVSSDDNGIPDVTSGKDIAAGAVVDLNHLLIVPRDGRGIKSDPKLKQDIYVMVRGSYLITNADGSKATT